VGNSTTLDVRLSTDILNVDEVVVVGYRTQARGTITGSVLTSDAFGNFGKFNF
jgi:hypothetical protein